MSEHFDSSSATPSTSVAALLAEITDVGADPTRGGYSCPV